MFVARLAGIEQAATVTMPSSTGMVTKVSGSMADTANKRLDIRCVTTSDAARPITVPREVSTRPGRKASARMSHGCALLACNRAHVLRLKRSDAHHLVPTSLKFVWHDFK
jgi:hypothetical protein